MTHQYKVGHLAKQDGISTIIWSNVRAHSYEEAVERGKTKFGDSFYNVENPHTVNFYGDSWASERTRGCWR